MHDTYPISVINDREIIKAMHFAMGISFNSFLRSVISFLNLFLELLSNVLSKCNMDMYLNLSTK